LKDPFTTDSLTYLKDPSPPTISAIHSTTMADAEFDEPERMKLLKDLITALESNTVPPTAWVCLWLSDVDRLRELVREAQAYPLSLMNSFENMENSIKLVQKCVFTNLIFLYVSLSS
jgi:hypothetical protein